MHTDESLPGDLAGDVVSSLVPGAGPVVKRMLGAVAKEWSRNRSQALKAAITTSGLSREDLAQRIAEQPELVPLVTRLLYEASMTGQGPLLEAMGAAFGAAAQSPDRATDYELVLAGLKDLRGDDVRVLREIRDRFVFAQQREQPEDETAETDQMQTVRRLSARLQMKEEALEFGLLRLSNQGFVTSISVLSGYRYTITELGRLLYDALERMNNS